VIDNQWAVGPLAPASLPVYVLFIGLWFTDLWTNLSQLEFPSRHIMAINDAIYVNSFVN